MLSMPESSGIQDDFYIRQLLRKLFALVSKLIQYDVDLAGIADKMITKPLNVNRMTGYIYEHLEVSPEGWRGVVLTKEVLPDRFKASDQLASLCSFQFLERLKGFWLGVCMWNKKMVPFRVHLRSKGPTVNHIAQVRRWRTYAACGIPSVTKYQILEVDGELKEAVRNPLRKLK